MVDFVILPARRPVPAAAPAPEAKRFRLSELPVAVPCAVDDCEAEATADRRFCVGHWCRLPRVLRDPLRDAWAVMSDRGHDPADRVAALDAHRDALAAAVRYIDAAAAAEKERAHG